MEDLTNRFAATERLDYPARIKILRDRKIEQTREKVRREGGLDEDDYGRVVPPEDFAWKIIPNHSDGSFYGYSGWADNFDDLMRKHPVYVDPVDALAGKWMFFLSRMKGPIWNPDNDYSYLKPELERYCTIAGIGSDAHFAPDYRIGLELGWGGLLDKLRRYRSLNGPASAPFYDAEEKTICAIQAWISRTIARIDEMAGAERNPELKRNLVEMGEVNRRVLEAPPSSLREVCQWIAWFNMASRTYNRDGAGGQLDELLRPYYERDLAAGRITEEEARFYIACLLLNDTHYYQLGGPDELGRDQTSRMSYLILEAADMIDSSCNLTVRVHEGMDEKFFLKAVGYLFANRNGWPRFSGDKALVAGFARCGFTPELARQRIAVGCNWMSLPGLEYTLNDLVKINVAKVFEVAFGEMMGEGGEGPSLERLWESFLAHLRRAIRVTAEGMDFHMKHQVENEPELVLNLLSHGPVEKGRDVTDGGAAYLNLAIDGAGIATIADSFAAIELRVAKEGRLDFPALAQALSSDFAGGEGEYLRRMLGASPRFGQGNSLGDAWASRISKAFSDEVRALCSLYPKYNFIPGWFSWANTIGMGKVVGATPNGRRKGEPINHGANPHPGFRRDGAVTAMANSIAAIQPGFGNTAPIQLELDPGIVGDGEGLGKIAALIRGLFEAGATLLNINIIDEKKILEAHRDPSLYPDLVVRVTGFTAYFSMLSPEFRQLVVDRIIAKN